MRLRKIEARTEESYALLFEDGTTLRCGPGELLDHHLAPGMELEGEAWEALREACDYYLVRRRAAALIAQRAMSAGELRQKLREKGADPLHAERAADWLLQLGAIDEESYAAMVVRHYVAKGYGSRRIRQELDRHRVPREYWEAALEQLPDSGETLDDLIRKKLRTGPLEGKERKKLADALLRRGYGWEEVRAALARNAGETADDSGE